MSTDFETDLPHYLHQFAPEPPDPRRAEQMIAAAMSAEVTGVGHLGRSRAWSTYRIGWATPLLAVAAAIAVVTVLPHNVHTRINGHARSTPVADASAISPVPEPCTADRLAAMTLTRTSDHSEPPVFDLRLVVGSSVPCVLASLPTAALSSPLAWLPVKGSWGGAKPPVQIPAGRGAVFSLTFKSLHVGCSSSAGGWSVTLAGGGQYPAVSVPLSIPECGMVPQALTFTGIE